jgi:hypothetical protein
MRYPSTLSFFALGGVLQAVVRRTHHCRRCDAAIEPGDVYAAVDVLDAEGRLRVLLCRSCATALRAFVGGRDTDEREADPARYDGDDTDERLGGGHGQGRRNERTLDVDE